MTSRTVLAACCVMPLTLGGTLIASQINRLVSSRTAAPLSNGYSVDFRFRGRVYLYDTNYRNIGLYRNDTFTPTTLPSQQSMVTAYLSHSTFSRVLRGTKRQPLYNASGELVGYTQLVPATRALPKYSVQSGGMHGWNKAFGYFDVGSNRLDWNFAGTGQVRFRYAENDRPLWRGTAHTLSKPRLAELREELSPREFAVQVSEEVKDTPDLTLTVGTVSTHITGYTSARATLPDGTPILIDILPPLTQ